MQIQFKNIVPIPLENNIRPDSEIWNTEVSFEKGKNYQIHAPSGKGKSTFVHIIFGLRQDFSGEAMINDKNSRKIKVNDWAKLRQNNFSIVFQDLRLFLELTALENIEAKAALYKKKLENEIKEMADFLGISHVLDKQAKLMSYGERQRTAIIRALIQPFDFLLLDEPFSHLDEENIQKAQTLIEEKRKVQNASVLMTTLGYEYDIRFDKKLIL